jgi:hypothetical protein
MRETIAILAAGVLIIGGAAVASAQVDETDDPVPAHEMKRGDHADEVLAELVEDGTITQAQSDAIVAAFEAKRVELQAQREERRAEMEAAREQLEEAWSDDVLTLEEAEALPFADRLTDPEGPLAEAWADGELTKDEVREARQEIGPRRGHGPRGFHGFGPGPHAPVEEGTSA